VRASTVLCAASSEAIFASPSKVMHGHFAHHRYMFAQGSPQFREDFCRVGAVCLQCLNTEAEDTFFQPAGGHDWNLQQVFAAIQYRILSRSGQ